MSQPIVSLPTGPGTTPARFAAEGQSLVIKNGGAVGPRRFNVHHEDDEAWHVLEGTLQFRFADGELEATGGSMVFVPAGVPHTYQARDARSLRRRRLFIAGTRRGFLSSRLLASMRHPARTRHLPSQQGVA